jgi:hypothetical protein
VWLNSPVARLLVALSTGLMITNYRSLAFFSSPGGALSAHGANGGQLPCFMPLHGLRRFRRIIIPCSCWKASLLSQSAYRLCFSPRSNG